MALEYQTQGIILSLKDSGEHDRIVEVFTERFGLVTARAVSVKKMSSKLRSGLEAFCHTDISFVRGKRQIVLTEAVLQCAYPMMRKSIERMSACYAIARVVSKVAKKEEEDADLWALLQSAMEELDLKDVNEAVLSLLPYAFLWRAGAVAGYAPLLDSCVECGSRSKNLVFSDMGMACSTCVIETRGISLSVKAREVIRALSKEGLHVLAQLATPHGKGMKGFRGASREYFAALGNL